MPSKIIHNLCKCGNKKQKKSNICRQCYLITISNPGYDKHKGLCNCGQTKSRYVKMCIDCRKNIRTTKSINNTNPIKNYRYKTSNNPNHWVKIRSHANRVADFYKMKKNGCCICKFPHVDVCHIKPITDFHEDTPINKVNDPSNLIILCKNCHWLFDHGYNSIESIKSYYNSIK